MPSVPEKLSYLAILSITDATNAFINGGTVSAWQKAMERVIAQTQVAVYIAATAQRLGIDLSKPGTENLISSNRLSKAERASINAEVATQLKYFSGFVADVRAGKLSDAAILARARLYAGATKSQYYQSRWGDWDIPQELLPGQQTCQGNCRCSVSVKDNGDGTGVLTRVMGGEYHCETCPPLAGDHSIRRKRQ